MKNEMKSDEELARELAGARQRIAELEQSAAEYRLTGEALRLSEERFRRITENMTDLVSEINARGEIIYVSPSHRKIVGEKPEDLIGKFLFDNLHPEDRDRVFTEYCEGIQKKTDREIEFRYLHADGSYVWIRSSGHPLYDAAGEYMGAVLNSSDITHHKMAEDALRVSEAKYRQLYESMMDAFVAVDMEGYIRDYNQSFLDMIGYTPEEISTLTYRDITPEKWHKMEADIREKEILKKGYSGLYEKEYRRKDGTVFPIELRTVLIRNDAGKPTGMQAIIRDISDRKKAEEELRKHRDHLEDLVKERTAELDKRNRLLENEVMLRERMNTALLESEAKYRFLTEKMSDVVWTADANLNVNYVSPSIERIRGFTPEERIRKPLNEILTPDSYAGALGTFAREIDRMKTHGADPGRSVNIELEFYHKDGSTVWMDNIVSAIYDAAGNLVGFHGVGRDITERKKAEEEKKRLENQLIQVQRIDALDRFAGGIAHDLNNILYPIIINTEQLLTEVAVDSSQHEILSQTLKAAYRQRDLIRKILTFSRKSEQAFSPIEILPLLEETMDFLRSSIPSTIDIQCHAEAKNDVIMGDPTKIQQVIMNLCLNAAYAMESRKGTLEVRLTDVRLEPAYSYQDLPAGDYVLLSVKDTGIGMSPDVMVRIFEPFFTTKGIGQGTGMGLAVVHGIVKSHGGAVAVQSVEGVGSVFTVYLPVGDIRSQGLALPANSFCPEKGKGKVLLVDDEETILSSLQRILKMSGYRVIALKDSREALTLFERKPGEFDLVITDQTMPGITGLELSKRLLEIRPDVPVILCTGFNDAVNGDAVKSLGIRELLQKPAGMSELKNVVRRALENESQPKASLNAPRESRGA